MGRNGGSGLKVRDLKKALRARGCRFVRASGDIHEIWQTPNGIRFRVPGPGLRGAVPQATLMLANQALKQARASPIHPGAQHARSRKKPRRRKRPTFATRRDLLVWMLVGQKRSRK